MRESPEPCLSGSPCRSPIACQAWGYCRERNHAASIASLADLGVDPLRSIESRRTAAARRRMVGPVSVPDGWVTWTVDHFVKSFPNLARQGDVETLALCVENHASVAGLTVSGSTVRAAIAERLKEGAA